MKVRVSHVLSVAVLFLLILSGCNSADPTPPEIVLSPEPHRPVAPATLPTATFEIPAVASPALAADMTGAPGEALQPTTGPEITPTDAPQGVTSSRGYLTTPAELKIIAAKAEMGLEPYASAVDVVLEWADRPWDFNFNALEDCRSSERPRWLDDSGGVPIVYAKALAYHLTGNEQYAEEVKDILEAIMTRVERIDDEDQQCRLNFGWGTPELVAAADLIEDYWRGMRCTGPSGTLHLDITIEEGDCKDLWQNWLVKNPYYIVSYSATSASSNWGAAATTATAYIADYLWDRPEVQLIHRNPPQVNGGQVYIFSPAQAYAFANQRMLDRMNGYSVEYGSRSSCDLLSGSQQSDQWEPVKSQITENGIIPEDARRDEYCNIPQYNGEYQNYPQIHLGNNIQQCELMLRRGDRSCYDNVDNTDLPEYRFIGPDGQEKVTHLRPGRGSIERAIKAIIVDSRTEWRHDAALEVAYRYYFQYHTLPGFEFWFQEMDWDTECAQDICFGTLTHGFAPGEEIGLPPTVPPPSD